jgi:peptide/nickel transport system substrate-binding protein
VGGLAKEWSFSDPTTFVVKLQVQATWQPQEPVNGRPPTAQDMKISIERITTESSDFVRSSDYALVEKVEAPDAQTGASR